MGDERGLTPVDERAVDFYGDGLTAYLVEDEPYVPIRPICEYLGVSWSGQWERIQRDEVLAEAARFVRVTRTNSAGGRPDVLCLPLKYLNGWLFGINARRVKPELREKIVRYQRECYEVLARAFQGEGLARGAAAVETLAGVREMALAVARLAEQQMALEGRVAETEERLDRAAQVVGELSRRLKGVEAEVRPSAVITEAQAAEISLQVKALAGLLQAQGGAGNTYQAVFAELYRRFGVSSYKLIRRGQYEAVLGFLAGWREEVGGGALTPGSSP